ncbi:MAG: hypothetical protein JNJ95_07510 [Dechloromonas sp.]|nr:hypothetical protein [Dechloromonas sp.]
MSDSNLNGERREREQRRRADVALPVGFVDRRVNIERRLFNLGVDCGKAWLSRPARDGARNATPLAPDVSASRASPTEQH